MEICLAIVHSAIGQIGNPGDHVFMSEKFFQTVGESPSECDTIRGRQCMASYFFLRKEFENANTYLQSIAMYLSSDDSFNWNYGIALASVGSYSVRLYYAVHFDINFQR